MKKKLFLILGITTFLIISALFGYINASKINLTDFSVTYLDITDEQLPESFKDKTIIFISDLEYGTFFGDNSECRDLYLYLHTQQLQSQL